MIAKTETTTLYIPRTHSQPHSLIRGPRAREREEWGRGGGGGVLVKETHQLHALRAETTGFMVRWGSIGELGARGWVGKVDMEDGENTKGGGCCCGGVSRAVV